MSFFQWIKSKHSISIDTKLNTYAYLKGETIDKVVIYMHGFGDSAEGASHLGDAFQLDNVLFLFVEGPQKVPAGFAGFQWFDLFHNPQKKIEESCSLVFELFRHLSEDHKIAPEKIYFMGFSQGGAMALHCGLQTKQKIGGIVSLSGFMIHTAKLIEHTNDLYKECPILLVHGDVDQVIFPFLFFETQNILNYLGFKRILTKLYHMEHTINPEEIVEIKNFLIS